MHTPLDSHAVIIQSEASKLSFAIKTNPAYHKSYVLSCNLFIIGWLLRLLFERAILRGIMKASMITAKALFVHTHYKTTFYDHNSELFSFSALIQKKCSPLPFIKKPFDQLTTKQITQLAAIYNEIAAPVRW